jgi:DNA-directed RNA polymerase subunit delta
MAEELSMLEIAYNVLSKSKKEMPFGDLWKEVVAEKGLSEDEQKARIGHFYTDLSLDGRFVALGDNTWDLRVRHKYEQVHIDVQDVYSDVEESDEDSEDAEEEKEYNAAVEGKEVPDETAEAPATDGEGVEPKGDDADPAELLGIKKDGDAY